MKICPTCKREFDDSEGFCKFDGTQLIMKVEAAVTGKKCPKCGKAYGEDDGFCSICGVKLIALVEDENKCPNCGAEMPEGAVFCSKCGARADLYAGHGGGSGGKLDMDNLEQYDLKTLIDAEAISHDSKVQAEIGDRLSDDNKTSEAIKWYLKSSEQGALYPKCMLGIIYRYDDEFKDEKKAFEMFEYIANNDGDEPFPTAVLS